MSDDMLYLELLQDAMAERDELFDFVGDHVSELIAPIVDGIDQYLNLPRGNVEIEHCEIDDENANLTLRGSINTTTGDHVAKVLFIVPFAALGTSQDPPSIDQLVQFMKSVDDQREASQRDVIIDLIHRAELELYYDSNPGTITERHINTFYAETLTEYNNRNQLPHQRTLH